MSYIYEQMGELDKAAELVSRMQSLQSNNNSMSSALGKHRGDRLEAIYTHASDTVKGILDRAERYYSEGRLLEFVEAILPLLEASADPRIRTRIQEEDIALEERPLSPALSTENENSSNQEQVFHESPSHFLLTFKRSSKKDKKRQVHFGVAEMGCVISTASRMRRIGLCGCSSVYRYWESHHLFIYWNVVGEVCVHWVGMQKLVDSFAISYKVVK